MINFQVFFLVFFACSAMVHKLNKAQTFDMPIRTYSYFCSKDIFFSNYGIFYKLEDIYLC